MRVNTTSCLRRVKRYVQFLPCGVVLLVRESQSKDVMVSGRRLRPPYIVWQTRLHGQWNPIRVGNNMVSISTGYKQYPMISGLSGAAGDVLTCTPSFMKVYGVAIRSAGPVRSGRAH
jgi:hypothetical protein